VGLACSHINNLHRKLVLTPKLFPIASVKCGERDRENVENVRGRIAYIQLTTSVELGCKVIEILRLFIQPSSTLVVRSRGV
jgi:hypothetical protein